MLPWFKADTLLVIRHRNLRIAQGRTATHLEAIIELHAMLYAGALDGLSHNAAAQTFGWTRKKLTRICSQIPEPDLGQVRGTVLPRWWATVYEQSQDPTDETGQGRGKFGASLGHTRARSSLEKKKEKKKKNTSVESQEPETKPKPERAPLPFKVGRSLRDVQLPEALIRFWSAYTAPEGPFPGATLTKAALGHLRAREKDYGADRLIGELIPWLCSDHDRALFLRSRGDVETPLRESNLERYLDLAERHRPAPDVDALIDQLRRSVLTGMTEGLSPELIAAVDSVGGLRVYGRANEREALRLERLIARRLGAA